MKYTTAMLVAVGVAFVSPLPVSAHKSGAYAESYVTATGIKDMWLRNNYAQTATYQFTVLTKDMQPIPPDHWRSNLEADQITLEPEEVQDVKVQTRYPGRYYICSSLTELGGESPNVRSVICLRHQHTGLE